MSKIICDICGTSYQDTADCCPICGCSRDAAADLLGDEVLSEDTTEQTIEKNPAASKKKEIFDFDEVNSAKKKVVDDDDEEDEDDDDDYDEEEDDDDEPRHNTFVVILLTVLIVGLIAAAGFIFVRYFLPNMRSEETVATTAPVQTIATTAAPTEATIPCEYLYMSNEGAAELNEAGQMFLLHVLVKPEDTTDQIIYTSGDENIATVTEDGKITAVAEGETTIYISCGKYSMEFPVVVKFVEETVPPTTEAVVEETVPETTAATVNVDPDVVLKLKKTDIMLGVYYQFTLELDCGLEQNQVEWSSEHPHIATVDENGVVTAVKSGTTAIIAKYGDQQVQCIVRCS